MTDEQLLSLLEFFEIPLVTESIQSEQSYAIEQGTIPVLVSAPHSVSQWRNGAEKRGEYRTGSIAQVLRRRTGCHCIYKTRNIKDDANFDKESPYRDELVSYLRNCAIAYILDLHIMHPSRPAAVDLGTGRGKNIQSRFDVIRKCVAALQKNGVGEVGVDKIFPASYRNTVSATVARETGKFALQIEMNWRILDVTTGVASLRRTLQGLTEMIDLLNGGLS